MLVYTHNTRTCTYMCKCHQLISVVILIIQRSSWSFELLNKTTSLTISLEFYYFNYSMSLHGIMLPNPLQKLQANFAPIANIVHHTTINNVCSKTCYHLFLCGDLKTCYIWLIHVYRYGKLIFCFMDVPGQCLHI